MNHYDPDHLASGPLIGVTGRRQPAGPSVVPVVQDALVEMYFVDYAAGIARAGGLPVHLSMAGDPEATVARLDAVVLSGGADVDPRRYGATPGPFATGFEPVRDDYELAVLNAAWVRGIPVLGICRGAQLINVGRGGTLVPHLPADSGEAHSFLGYPRQRRVHPVDLAAGSVPHRLYGDRVFVNSLHHQAVDQVGDDLVVTGRAPDGVVESIEAVDAPIVGVQWHPEMLDGTDPLFAWLVEAAASKNRQIDRKQEKDVVIA
ncbi:MAG: gamma-glutamyl-gamma-aminobutyrate hydrolase family protein [Mycobacterium sp.]